MTPALREDSDALRLVLDTLLACVSPEPSEDLDVKEAEASAAQNCAALSRTDRAHASTLLDVLEERDWGTRLSVLKILGALQAHRPAELQNAILASPQVSFRALRMCLQEQESYDRTWTRASCWCFGLGFRV